jgi:sigma-B regulation protein RsbU (phosphoserine phosphatase)
MSAEAEPESPPAVPAPFRGAAAADWQILFSLEKRDADDRAVIEKALGHWSREAGARKAALFALTEGGLQPITAVGELTLSASCSEPPAGLARLDLPGAALFHDSPGLHDAEERSLLLIAAAVRICRLKTQLFEHRFQANLRGVELQALYEVGLAIASTLDFDRLGEEVLLRAVSLLDARRAGLYLAENGTYRLLSQFGGENARPAIPDCEVDVAGLMADQAAPPEGLLPGVRHLLAVPVEIDGSPRGLLVVGDKESRSGIGPFGAKDRRMALLFANQAAIALENAKLHKMALEKERLEREMELASEIQKQILPKSTPKIEGYELAGWYRPARHVGGDYYSFLNLGPDRHGLVVADVTGKGMPAALLVSTVHSAAKLLLDRVGPGSEFISLLNDHIWESSKSNKFITFLFAWLELETHTLSWVNAGHNPGLLVRSSGQTVQLTSSGVPLGLIPKAPGYRAASVELEPGDLVCLYSDGITECEAPDDEQYGLDRLEILLRQHEGRPLEEILKIIDQKMVEFAASRPQGDDQTVVLLRRR